jgi:hypothetical protein
VPGPIGPTGATGATGTPGTSFVTLLIAAHYGVQNGNYMAYASSGVNGTESNITSPLPIACTTIDRLYVAIGSTASSNVTITLRRNGAATAITCSAAAGGTCNDLTHSLTNVPAGTMFTYSVTGGGSGSGGNGFSTGTAFRCQL